MLRLDKDRREALARAKAEIAEIMDPLKAAERKQRRQRDREMRKRVGKRAPGQRQPRERDPGYLAFLRRLPCIAAVMGRKDCEGATQAAHLRLSDAAAGRRNPGMSNKPHDRHANPLCAHHHLRDQHVREEQAFWNGLGVDPGDLSAALYAAYQAGDDGSAVLRRFSPRGEQ